MAVPQLAANAVSLAAKYGPQAIATATTALQTVTSGKVSSIKDIPGYVQSSKERLTVVTDALLRSGFTPDDVLPLDIVGRDQNLGKLRAAAVALFSRLQAQREATADKALPRSSDSDVAADMIRIRRVQTALEVFTTEERYFLCIPTGGIPASDFAYYRAVQRALYKRG